MKKQDKLNKSPSYLKETVVNAIQKGGWYWEAVYCEEDLEYSDAIHWVIWECLDKHDWISSNDNRKYYSNKKRAFKDYREKCDMIKALAKYLEEH